MDPLKEKEENRKKFEKTGRNRRQDRGTRGTTDERKDSDVSEWLESASRRRDARHGADEDLTVEIEKGE